MSLAQRIEAAERGDLALCRRLLGEVGVRDHVNDTNSVRDPVPVTCALATRVVVCPHTDTMQ